MARRQPRRPNPAVLRYRISTHRRDQFVSYAATCWATMALLRDSVEESGRLRRDNDQNALNPPRARVGRRLSARSLNRATIMGYACINARREPLAWVPR